MYFLDNLSKLILKSKQYNIELYEDKFFDLAELMKIILKEMNVTEPENNSAEEFYNCLIISTRFTKK